MGILNFVEEAAGAFASDKALEAVDPNAGILAKGTAAFAGFEGVSKLKEMLAGSGDEQVSADQGDTGETAAADDDQDDDST